MPEKRLTGHLSIYSPDEVLPTTRYLVDTLENFEPAVTAGSGWLGENTDANGVPRLVLMYWGTGHTNMHILVPGLSYELWSINEYFPSSLRYERTSLLHSPSALGHYGNFRWDETSRRGHNNISIPLIIEGSNSVDPNKPSTFPRVTLEDIQAQEMPELWRNTGAKGFDHWQYGVKFLLETMKPLLDSLKHQPDISKYSQHENFIHSLYRFV